MCILRGCMPTKALLYAAEVLHLASHPGAWGIRTREAGFDFPRVMARKDEMVREFAGHRRQQLDQGTFKFLRGQARFLDPHTVALGTGETLTADHFIISTGSIVAPSPLHLAGLGRLPDQRRRVEPDGVAEIAHHPRRRTGGGGVRPVIRAFGSASGAGQRSPRILPQFDMDASSVLEEVFRREGIAVFTNTKLLGAERKGSGKSVTFLHDAREVRVEAEEILFALGRVANTDGLDLAKAGVAIENRRIVADANMRTSAGHIYAAGDCTGPHDIVHIAVQQGEVAAHNIANPREPRQMDPQLLISIVFTEPQIAVTGLSEKEALAREHFPSRRQVTSSPTTASPSSWRRRTAS